MYFTTMWAGIVITHRVDSPTLHQTIVPNSHLRISCYLLTDTTVSIYYTMLTIIDSGKTADVIHLNHLQ